MTAALLTAVLFAFSAVFSQRAARLYGPLPANAMRLTLACLCLGLLTWAIDSARGRPSLVPEVLPVLLLSGLVGFGLGDAGLFLAYPRLGARLTILLNFSLGTVFAAWGDWLWLGEQPSSGQWGGVALVLSGLGLALWPSGGPAAGKRHPWGGLGWALMAAAGQGFGTTLSGQANRLAALHQVQIHGISQAFQRSLAGVAAAVLIWAVWRRFFYRPPMAARPEMAPREAGRPSKTGEQTKRKHAGFWLAGTVIFGPVAGVSCFQWARLDLPSAVVVAVAATSTLWVIPLARLIDRDRATGRQTAGALLAVAGIAALCLAPRS